MDDLAISVNGVSKAFKLPHEKQSSVKGLFIGLFSGSKTFERQQVLNDVSFQIKKGEFFGIVGKNGSGKSTLLKLISGIYTPNKGAIHVTGKLTPFIELGVGFNPELTGKDNVFLNGALLGFSRKEVERMYDEIVGFAELEQFMDQKLKNYSSGMQVRLAFSIAIQVNSDVLVLDEVLAVGDEAFQKKCVRVFDDYKRNNKTVVLVTHDMETVKKYCSRAILLDKGHIISEGNPTKVAEKYSQLNENSNLVETKEYSGDLKIDIHSKDHKYESGKQMKVELSWPESLDVDNAGLAIYSSLGVYVFGANTTIDKVKISNKNHIMYNVDLDIGTGEYFVMAGISKGKGIDEESLGRITDGPRFMVIEKVPKGEGISRLEHSWSFEEEVNNSRPGK